MKKIGKNKTIG